MTDPGLSTLEREVEQARAKFAADLARVRSPTTFANFKDDLLIQARGTKDELLERTTQAIRETTHRMLQDIKDRALANPAAALAIGAGLAWRLARHPPISTVLIGFGLVSLLRTSPHSEKAHETAARHLADARSRAKELADTTQHRVEELTEHARERVSETVQGLAEHASAVTERAGAFAEQTRRTAAETISQTGERASDLTRDLARRAREEATGLTERASEVMREAVPDPGTRDKLLLGAATLAVTAAVGIAYQRRMHEREREAA